MEGVVPALARVNLDATCVLPVLIALRDAPPLELLKFVHCGVTDRALTRAAPEPASGRAARPLPRLMVTPEGARWSGRDAVRVPRRQATLVPDQRTATRRVQRRVSPPVPPPEELPP